MKKIIAMLLALVMVFALCACGAKEEPAAAPAEAPAAAPAETPAEAPADAATYEYPEMTIQFAHVNAIDQPIGVAVDKFAKLINERSGGKITIDVYPASSLYDQNGIYDALSLDNLDMGIGDVSGISNTIPAYGLYALPMLYDSYDTMAKIVDGEVGAALDAMLPEGMNAYALGWGWNGFRNMVTNDPITCSADCKDYLLRSPDIQLYLDTFHTLGFATVTCAWGDCFTAMQSGLVNGVETTTEAIYTQGFYTVGNNVCVSHHMLSIIGPMINANLWESMDEQTQKLFKDTWMEVREEWNAEVIAGEEKYLNLLEEAGANITYLEDADYITELFTPMWEEYAKNGGYEDLLAQAIACMG